ncbi:hypothetical protein JK363_19645 [Streptomyces sp. 205]|uniref:Uncharacterized protein n=2 Tax=Streptomyces coffeae TaxID=621382 RepID=A0ABS1NFG0_9ACTN|nr:hypothetical protein [Streptomyces coffeae]
MAGGESRGTVSERKQRVRRERLGRCAPLFDGRPQVEISNVKLLPDEAIQLATAFGYRYLRTRGHKAVRYRIFVPDPNPVARQEALAPGTPVEVVAQHPAFQGLSARAARNHAEMIRGERNLLKVIPVLVVMVFGIVVMAVQAVRSDAAVLLAPIVFFILLVTALLLMLRKGLCTQRELEERATRLSGPS